MGASSHMIKMVSVPFQVILVNSLGSCFSHKSLTFYSVDFTHECAELLDLMLSRLQTNLIFLLLIFIWLLLQWLTLMVFALWSYLKSNSACQLDFVWTFSCLSENFFDSRQMSSAMSKSSGWRVRLHIKRRKKERVLRDWVSLYRVKSFLEVDERHVKR